MDCFVESIRYPPKGSQLVSTIELSPWANNYSIYILVNPHSPSTVDDVVTSKIAVPCPSRIGQLADDPILGQRHNPQYPSAVCGFNNL
jgi:hypothetical protein